MRVGFIGLGDQGEPMARRILDAGHPLTVYARRPVQAKPLVGRGAVEAGSVGALAERSDLLGVCVGTDAQVREVCAAALPRLRPGSLLVIHSTVAPGTCTRIGADAAARGVQVIDAPVSGGRARAFAGELTVMVGGEPAAVERARPVLDTFGALVLHVGPLGSGEMLKLVNNYLFAAQIGIAEDAVRLLRDLGLDVRPSMTAIAASTGSTRALEMFVAGGCEHVFPRHQDGRARGAELLSKDIGLIDAEVAGAALRFPELLDRAVRAGLRIAQDSGEAGQSDRADIAPRATSGPPRS